MRELEVYVEAGFPSGEALAAATIEPARLLKVEAQTGSIAVGKTADLLLVDGDPQSASAICARPALWSWTAR